ncbi:MAG: ABC transporter permease [Gammaproteobacteria bacterium]|nr:ABC transporter permease [Gammaproteobacteria bacterium]
MTPQISIVDLMIAFVPVLLVLMLMWRAQHDVKKSVAALARMLMQLILVGYFLLYIFNNSAPEYTAGLLLLMMSFASWISLNVAEKRTLALFIKALLAILIGGGAVLIVITQGVLDIEPWYNPRYILPLAGMIFASSMTAISLSLERYYAELKHNTCENALNVGFKAAMIPVVNSMLAVGVVSLPGMMTGQILSGVEPYIAARYQIMVMAMMFSATGLTVFVFLKLLAERSKASDSTRGLSSKRTQE